MAKPTFQSNPRVHQIFDDLEKYLEFCRDYGYKYNESDLYNQYSYVYRSYTKFVAGKPVKNQWVDTNKV
jgi:hypothetical protein